MIRQATVRLPIALLLVATGAYFATFGGRPEAAVLVSPWAVLLLAGLAGSGQSAIGGTVTIDRRRVLTGDRVRVTARLNGARGWIESTWQPAPGFTPQLVQEELVQEELAQEEVADERPDHQNRVRRRGGLPFGLSSIGSASSGRSSSGSASVGQPAVPDRPTDLHHDLTATDWGLHDVGRVALTIHEPFGLLRWSGTLHTPNEVRVHPDPIEVRQLLTPWLTRRLTGAHPSSTVGRGVEFADIRPFESGDTLREINWRASARSDRLWVSQRHPERSTDVVLLLDTFTESGHDVRSVLGAALEVAVALAESHLSVNDRVGVIEVGGIIRWVGLGSGRNQLQRLTDALLATRLYENAADRPLAAIPPWALPPRSFIVALSPLLDERFIGTIAALRGAGHDLSVIEYPPVPPAARQQQQLRQASRLALRFWDVEREMVRDRLSQQGVVVGRWEPGQSVDQVLATMADRRRRVRAVSRR